MGSVSRITKVMDREVNRRVKELIGKSKIVLLVRTGERRSNITGLFTGLV